MASKTTEKAGPGHIHAKIVDDAEKIMHQFNTPVLSADLLNKLTGNQVRATTAPVETSTTITMGTYGAGSDGKKQLAAQLVANEGIASLEADCELILKLVTKLTESPAPKKAQ